MMPQTATGTGFIATAWTEVWIAVPSTDIAVEQQRERDDADRQGKAGKEEADAATDHDHGPARRRQEDVMEEGAHGERLVPAPRIAVCKVSAAAIHSTKTAIRMNPSSTMLPIVGHASTAKALRQVTSTPIFALTAHLIKAEAGEGADQGEARGHREEQRQHVIAEGGPRQDQADDGIDDAEEEDIGAIGAEIRKGLLEDFGNR